MIRDKWTPQARHLSGLVGMTCYANMIDGQTGEIFLRDGQPYTAESIERMLAMPCREYRRPRGSHEVYWYTEDLPVEETQ